MSGLQGYRFGNKKAELLRRKAAELRRDPDARRRLLGLKPKRSKASK